MMRATDFEFKNRWWLFGCIYGLPFVTASFDHEPLGGRIASRLMPLLHVGEMTAVHVVFGVSAILMLMAGSVRTWGSSYLGREVVHDHAVHSESLHADGPYRYVRNPLYLGNVLMAFAIAPIAPWMGSVLIVAGLLIFSYRLIGREEAFLEQEQGERYRAYLRAVPRLLPSPFARIPAGNGRPDWFNGWVTEAYFWSFVVGVIAFSVTLNLIYFFAGLVCSPLMSWIAAAAFKRRSSGVGA